MIFLWALLAACSATPSTPEPSAPTPTARRAGAAAAAAPAAPGDLVGEMTVTDGDTLRLGATRIRLFGIDAPERKQQCTDSGGASFDCGTRSRDAMAALVAHRTVRCVARDKDRWARVVAMCSVDGQDVGALLVRAGWATAYERYSKDYVDEQVLAKAEKAGLWAGSFQSPSAFRRDHRSE